MSADAFRWDDPDLMAYVDGTEPPTEALREAWRIDDDAQATWAMRKVRDAQLRLNDTDRIATAEIDRIQTWALTERRKPEREIAFFAHLLEAYALRLRALDDKRKSISTPYGKVQTRTKQPAWSIVDDEFLPWAREHRPDLVKTVESPKLADTKAALTLDGDVVHDGTGTVVPGITVTPAGLAATVTPDVAGAHHLIEES